MHKFSVAAVTAVALAAFGATLPAQGQARRGPTKGSHTGAHAKGAGQSSRPSSPRGGADSGDAASKAGGHASERASEKKTIRPSASKDKSNGSGGRTTPAGTGGNATTQSASEPNAVSTRISNNPNQLARVKAMLPAGMTIEEASAGFRNQGQFIAALNASKNQQIDFVQLKEAMTVGGLSLGQAAKETRAAAVPAPVTGSTAGTGTTSESATASGGGTSPRSATQ